MPGAYFQLVLRQFGGTPERDAALCAGTGIAVDALPDRITLGQQLQQLRNVNHLEPPGWAFGTGTLVDAATHGPVAFAALSAPTLGEALDVLARFAHVRFPYFRLEVGGGTGQRTFRIGERTDLTDAERMPLFEMLMLSLQGLVERVLGHPMREAQLAFAYPAPSYAGRYAERFQTVVRFDADATALTLPASWLALRSPFADPVMFEASVRKLESQLRELDGDGQVAARVEQLMASSRDGGPSLSIAARRLGMSSRTLVRRLQQAGTSYLALLDDHRRARAAVLLRDPHLGIAEVSHCLGYGDPANFGRACRRWFGMAPGAYRRGAGGG